MKTYKYSGFLALLAVLTMSACSSMPRANNALSMAEFNQPATISENIVIHWKVENKMNITIDEKNHLIMLLKTELEDSVNLVNVNLAQSSLQLHAVINNVETVTPALNWLSTVFLFVPVDRGGIDVDFVAINKHSRLPVAKLNFAEWAPISEFSARFNRLAPAEIQLKQAVNNFVTLLQGQAETLLTSVGANDES